MGVAEAPNNNKGKYLQLHFIPSLQSERIPVFEVSLRRSTAVIQMYQHLLHINFPIGEGPKSSHMSGLADTGSVLKDLKDVDPFNISGVEGGK